MGLRFLLAFYLTEMTSVPISRRLISTFNSLIDVSKDDKLAFLDVESFDSSFNYIKELLNILLLKNKNLHKLFKKKKLNFLQFN